MNSSWMRSKKNLTNGWMIVVLAFVMLMGNADATPTIDGVFGLNEWDDYLLGTSITMMNDNAEMSVNVYATILGNMLYAAYLADNTVSWWSNRSAEPGWWGVSNLTFSVYYEDSSRQDTFLGYHEGVYQDFDYGSGWIAYNGNGDLAGDLTAIGIDAYLSTPATGPLDTNLIELAIPLSFLIPESGAERIVLSGQYWHGVPGQEFEVNVPVPEPVSMLMLGSLGAGMFATRKLRRRKSA